MRLLYHTPTVSRYQGAAYRGVCMSVYRGGVPSMWVMCCQGKSLALILFLCYNIHTETDMRNERMRVPPALSLALNELACRTTKEEFTEVCLRIAIHHRGEDIPNAKTVMNSLVATFWTFDQDDILCPHGENSTWTCIICNNLADEASNTWRNGV